MWISYKIFIYVLLIVATAFNFTIAEDEAEREKIREVLIGQTDAFAADEIDTWSTYWVQDDSLTMGELEGATYAIRWP